MGDDEFGPFQRSSDSYLVRWLSGVNKIFFENTHKRIFHWVVSDVYNRKFACIVTFTGQKKIRATRPVIVFCGYEAWAILYAWTGKDVIKIQLAD
jgi:hypothetical protein